MSKPAYKKHFDNYKTYINGQFIDKFGKSYDTVNSVGSTWRITYPYSHAAEEFLVFQSTLFIKLFCHYYNEESNIRSLNKLVYSMAQYLSSYTSRGIRTPDQTIVTQDLAARLMPKRYRYMHPQTQFTK